jgi:predicted acylesterase/phospholipase RssA
VDVSGGTSIGAPIAGWVAQGRSADEALSAALESFRSLIDYTLPLASLISGKRITDSIQRQAGSWDIEDLWLPFFCVSTSLTTSRAMAHQRGNSALAIRASVSIPGVLPPVSMNGELLVDGSVVNNLPVDVMRTLNPIGPVVAIDVVSPKGPQAKTDHGLSVSGWSLALHQITPWRKSVPVPSLASTILRSMLVGAGQAREDMLEAGLADLYHNIHVRGVGMLDFEKVAKVAQIGYEESIEPLRRWLESGGLQQG